jgi:hypothetical protein
MTEENTMTKKAQAVLQKMNLRRLFRSPETRDRVLDEFNASTLDHAGPVRKEEQGMKFLREMNELEEFENENWSRIE